MEAAIWGLLGTVVGALTSIGTTWLSHWSSSRLQTERVRSERVAQAKSFQKETLLELQEALYNWLRINSSVYFEDLKAYVQTRRWGENRLTEEVNEGLLQAARRVSILLERVMDDALRSKTKSLLRLATEGHFASTKEGAELNLQKVTTESLKVFEDIGSTLRTYYESIDP